MTLVVTMTNDTRRILKGLINSFKMRYHIRKTHSVGPSNGAFSETPHFGRFEAQVESQKSRFAPNFHLKVLPMVLEWCRDLTWVMGEKFWWVVISSHMGNQDYIQDLLLFQLCHDRAPEGGCAAGTQLGPYKTAENRVSRPRHQTYHHRE